MDIGITGENGFIGSHLLMSAKRRYGHRVISFGRPFKMRTESPKIDKVIHCAAVHRDNNPDNIYKKNMEIHNSLVSILESNNLYPSITMLSSIQEGDGTPYGKSKKDGADLLSKFCAENNARFLKFNLNNTFGPFSEPYKYSFVATFCFNIINDIPCSISDRGITLSYIDDVVDSIFSDDNKNYHKYETSVMQVYEKLLYFKKSFINKNQIPKFNSRFDFLLYNTLISFIKYRGANK